MCFPWFEAIDRNTKEDPHISVARIVGNHVIKTFVRCSNQIRNEYFGAFGEDQTATHTYTHFFWWLYIFVYACILAVYYKCTCHIYPSLSFVRSNYYLYPVVTQVHTIQVKLLKSFTPCLGNPGDGIHGQPWKPTSLKTQTKIPRKPYRNTRFYSNGWWTTGCF